VCASRPNDFGLQLDRLVSATVKWRLLAGRRVIFIDVLWIFMLRTLVRRF